MQKRINKRERVANLYYIIKVGSCILLVLYRQTMPHVRKLFVYIKVGFQNRWMYTTMTSAPFQSILQWYVATSYILLVLYGQTMPHIRKLFVHFNMFAIVLDTAYNRNGDVVIARNTTTDVKENEIDSMFATVKTNYLLYS